MFLSWYRRIIDVDIEVADHDVSIVKIDVVDVAAVAEGANICVVFYGATVVYVLHLLKVSSRCLADARRRGHKWDHQFWQEWKNLTEHTMVLPRPCAWL
jgi:hypothetical protein